MKTKLHLIILSLVLLFIAGGQSVCLAAESWSYPTSKQTIYDLRGIVKKSEKGLVIKNGIKVVR